MKKTLITLISVLVVLIVGGGFTLYQAINPYDIAEEDAYEYASEHTDFQELDEFYVYNGTDGTFLTVTGTDSKGVYMVAIIEQTTGNIDLFNQNEIISEYDAVSRFNEAKPDSEIMHVRIGKDEGTPIWEITYRMQNQNMGYYIMNLTNGDMIKTIENL